MPVDPNASLVITAFDWVPDFAQGFVRDLRPRWACEEIGLPYAERLISAVDRPVAHYRDQPWGQVPVIDDGGIRLFESGAILLHLGERHPHLLPVEPQPRADTLSWLFAAFNSIEPMMFELGQVTLFAAGEPWAELRKPSLLAFIGERFDRLATALGERDWLTGRFSIADIAMATVLREAQDTGLLAERPVLARYLARATARPAFARALGAQIAAFTPDPPPGAQQGEAA
ncbi:glutathione S-transferase family protein [Blastomonas sp.]|uniref:glutathione S-transferase family protein n=1 Tax=Blastomonas sp. TaxID=1909299 RepID=UPI0026276F61|nr:glutathione S-transferase family protein [Blastomonas sp.]MDM7955923.1 glutathione S-transferase family protein [Blastomonas sp.]